MLLKDIDRNGPIYGLGEPEMLKGDLLGEEPQGLIYRKGIVVSAGYIFEI